MNKLVINKILIFVAFLLSLSSVKTVWSQDCARKLDSVNYLYSQGIIEDIPELLKPCIYEGFSNEQKIGALKLVTMSYLIDDNQAGAETTMELFLKLFPNYEVRSGDPIEFVYLLESYRTYSIFSVGVLAGTHITLPYIHTPYTLGNFNLNKRINYRIEPAFRIGLNIGRYITNSLELESGLFYGNTIFTIEDKNFEFATIQHKETHTFLELPLLLNYDITRGSFTPILTIGGSASYIISTSGEPTVDFNSSINDVVGSPYSMEEQRSQFNFFAIGGIGFKYKSRSGSIIFRTTYAYGINKINKSDKRLSNNEVLTEFYYIDSDFSLNQIGISIGYTYNFYKTEKFR